MPKPKHRRKAAKRALRKVAKFAPDSDAARDEGPRLIPLPDGRSRPLEADLTLPANRYVALADLALRLWADQPAGSSAGDQPDSGSPRRRKR